MTRAIVVDPKERQLRRLRDRHRQLFRLERGDPLTNPRRGLPRGIELRRDRRSRERTKPLRTNHEQPAITEEAFEERDELVGGSISTGLAVELRDLRIAALEERGQSSESRFEGEFVAKGSEHRAPGGEG